MRNNTEVSNFTLAHKLPPTGKSSPRTNLFRSWRDEKPCKGVSLEYNRGRKQFLERNTDRFENYVTCFCINYTSLLETKHK